MKVKSPKENIKDFKQYKITLKWNADYFEIINKKLKTVLLGVSEYSKDIMNDKYVPKSSGALIESSEIELLSDFKADIKWEAPYASEVYYDKSLKLKEKRGSMWFDRMFEDYRNNIEKEANRIYKS